MYIALRAANHGFGAGADVHLAKYPFRLNNFPKAVKLHIHSKIMFMRDGRLQTTPCFGELTLTILVEYKVSGSWISLAGGDSQRIERFSRSY